MNDVILFLTTQPNELRKQMALTNLKQLKKLNKDIIILSTTPIVDQEFHDIAKYIIVDENKNVISKSLYKKLMGYSQPYRGGRSVFHYSIENTRGLNIIIYQNTNYLNVYKNTKNIINFATALGYENFFYVEDDHYFSNVGLDRISKYFDDVKSLNAIYFTNKWHHDVIRSHFWFGNCNYFQESILNKFPECMEDIDDNYPCFTYYELFLYTQMYDRVHNKNKIVSVSFDETTFNQLFGQDSQLNQHSSDDKQNADAACNILYNFKSNENNFLFINKSKNKQTHVVVYKNNIPIIDKLLKIDSEGWILEPISIDGEIKVKVDNDIIKTFNLTPEEVLLNGYIN